ncbi:hypothetical protein SO802_028228 [Lithocarpus litseifolius]|uniref:Uncharacterized protein n=1 Tax=Lithocarpus litseifolius TaxID=425828 RepID=A0AAW2BSS2_9ROSI
MQGIRDKGDADWRSTDVGAAVGVFEVPTDMTYYKATTTAGGGRFPRQSEQYSKVIIEGDYKEVMDSILKASKNASWKFAKTFLV